MANYISTARTNYFRVKDEDEYSKLFKRLRAEGGIEDFTKEVKGTVYHGFGAYSSIAYLDETDDFNFDSFLDKLRKILPDDEAFIYTETGYEKLRYVTGYAIVCTKAGIKSTNLEEWAIEAAKEMLGKNFTTELYY